MKENKFGALLTTFKTKDWTAYHKFSKSRYGEDTDHQKVMDYIKKHRSRFDPKKMDTEYLRCKVRPDIKPIVFSNVISQLCKHIESYFIWAEVMDDPMMEDTLLLKAYGKRGLTDQFHKQKKKAKSIRDKQPLGLWKHYHEFMGEYYEYYKRMTTSVAGSKVVLENCYNAIVNFYADLQGYLGVEMHNRENVLEELWDSKYKHLNKNDELGIINSVTLFHFYKKLKEKRDWESFNLLKNELQNDSLSKELEFTTITHLGSFLKWKTLNNDNIASQELIDLYSYGLEKNILFPNKIIPLNSFATMIRIGSATGNFEWSENFITKYSHFVSDKNTEQIKSFGFAHLSYTKGKFESTIEILRSKRFDNFMLELKAKWLLLSSLYETRPHDIESFRYYTDSLKSYIRRNKEKSTIDGYQAFMTSVNFLKRLIILEKISELESDIRNEQKMIHKQWFLEKIKGLRIKDHSP